MSTKRNMSKVFNRCQDSLRGYTRYFDVKEFLAGHKDEILLRVPVPEDKLVQRWEQYENLVLEEMKHKIVSEIQDMILHRVLPERVKVATLISSLHALESEILIDTIDVDNLDDFEWGGAGLIITSDPNRRGWDGDRVVNTSKHALKIIGWILNRFTTLLDNHDELDDDDRYLYPSLDERGMIGLLAESAGDYLEMEGRPKNLEYGFPMYILSCIQKYLVELLGSINETVIDVSLGYPEQE
jgi:hypothetical protein